ncbi:type II secretion system protein GspG [Acidobacteria bacterium AH-259-L09]|nr:type II secretion system protein GspG [Acidobacteria bacterium AH-259-L09]
MKRLGVCLFLLASLACGKSLEKQVQDQVRTFANASLGDKQVEVKNVRRMGDQAVAEIEITTAVRLTKKDGKWVIDEFRIGDRRWEKAEDILEVINEKRTGKTLQQMNLLAERILRYTDVNGQVPQVSSFEALIDLLTPQFLDRIIRIDAWSNPFSYQATGANEYNLRSAGPDGNLGTPDDLVTRMRNGE